MISSIVSITLMFAEILAGEIALSKYLHRRRQYVVRLAVGIAVCAVTWIVTLVSGFAGG